jgi:Ca2+:H+ antiporter
VPTIVRSRTQSLDPKERGLTESIFARAVVGAIDEFAQDYKIPKAFIGLILLPIVGNAAGASADANGWLYACSRALADLPVIATSQSTSRGLSLAPRSPHGPLEAYAACSSRSVWMAAKGKMELTIGVAIGSSIQVRDAPLPARLLYTR